MNSISTGSSTIKGENSLNSDPKNWKSTAQNLSGNSEDKFAFSCMSWVNGSWKDDGKLAGFEIQDSIMFCGGYKSFLNPTAPASNQDSGEEHQDFWYTVVDSAVGLGISAAGLSFILLNF